MNTICKRLFVLGGAWVVLGMWIPAARAAYITDKFATNSPGHKTLDELVLYPTPAGTIQVDSFFDIFTDWDQIAPPPPGGTQIDSFFDVFTEISLALPGAPFHIRESPTRHSHIRTTNSGPSPTGDGQVFDTEMLSLDLAGGTLPPGVMIRESPTKASLGKTTITDIGGGLYRINSFFDVFTELSIDGGQTWTEGSGPMHMVGIPEPSTLTLAGMGLAACAAMAIRRRRRAR